MLCGTVNMLGLLVEWSFFVTLQDLGTYYELEPFQIVHLG